MTLKSHISQWEIVAKYLDIHQRSLETARKRYSCGQPFFTVNLPSLGKDLERGLTGFFELSNDTPFRVKKGTALPEFLYELFIKIFHQNGFIRVNPVGIAELRFLCKMYYKFEAPLSDSDVDRAVEKFSEIDSAVKTGSYPYGLSEVRKYFTSLFPEYPKDIRPHHASGATSTRLSNLEKRHNRVYIPRLMEYYDPTYFFNSKHHVQNWCEVNETTHSPGIPRVTFVPKDSRGPRTICIFHHMDMFIQKGLQEKLYEFTEKGYSPAKGFINFSRQDINQHLAYVGSYSCKYATIDLKDASDLVPWNLVKMLCPTEWYQALACSRSDVVTIQGRQSTINKFAPMGSALCFPIEAFVFWSIAKTVSPYVYVYGDDIIVPNGKVHDVIAALESYGLLVNHDKSLYTGLFRESCGGDYYDGQNINYPSCKSYDTDKYIAFCNQVTELISSDLAERLVKSFEEMIDEIVYREPLVFAKNPEPYIFYTDSCAASFVFFKHRGNIALQREEVLRKHIKSVPKKSKKNERKRSLSIPIDDDLLFDWFTTAENTVAPEEEARVVRLMDQLVPSRYLVNSFSEGHQTLRRDTSPGAKYVWGFLKKE